MAQTGVRQLNGAMLTRMMEILLMPHVIHLIPMYLESRSISIMKRLQYFFDEGVLMAVEIAIKSLK